MMKNDPTFFKARSNSQAPWRAALFACALTLGAASQAQVVFTEDFTGGASTAGFTTGQSEGTCGWVYDNPSARDISGAGFDADFAIFDSDNCGEGNSTGELISPAFDATAGNFILSFDQSYHYCCSSIATVEVWDGTTWTNVYTLPDASVGYGNPAVSESINITAATNGYSSAQVRFQYTGDYAWWWALDNIVLEEIDCLAPSDLAVTGITVEGGTISWTDNGSVGYDWAVTAGDEPDGSNELAEGDGSLTSITGLNSNTTYTAWVRADCGDGSFSDWSAPVNFFTGYCTPAPTSVDGSGITNVSFSGVDNTTDAEDGNYGDYSAMVGTVQQLTTATVSITYSTGYTYGTKIWVDANDDLDFDDDGELVYTGISTNENPTTLIATFPVGTMPLGQHRMRISGTDNDGGASGPCYTGSYGTFEDYTLQVDPAPSCIPISDLAMTAFTGTSVDFSWTASLSDPAGGYQWEVRSANAPGSGSDGLAASGSTAAGVSNAQATGLTENTNYSIYVRSDCGDGDFSTWTGPVDLYTGYCTPEGTNPDRYIDDFVTAGGESNIENSGSGFSSGGYGDFTGMTASTYAGNSIDFSATHVGGTFLFRVWIDWNHDLDFADPGELVFDGTDYESTHTGTITVPDGTPEGTYAMRIRNNWNGTPTPCASDNLGETEDYTFAVTPTSSCLPPTDVATTAVTALSVDFSWTASASDPANGYQWEVRTANAPGSGSDGLAASGATSVGVTNDAAAGLSSNTGYSIYVRSDCGSGNFSSWTSATTFTTSCGAADIPYYEDFSSVIVPAIPNCMSIETISGNPWTTNAAPIAGMIAPAARVTYTGGGSPDMDSWLYTAGLNLTGGVSYQLTYKYGNNSTFYNESMSVAYGSGASEADMLNPLADHPTINDNTTHINTVEFIPDADGVYYIGFKCYSVADQYYLFLDDIQVIVTPECYAPVASTWIAPDCDNAQYYVHVDLTGLGDATSVDIMSDYAGNPGGQTGITEAGDYTVGPFPDLSTANITVVHNDNVTCNLVLDPVSFDCADNGKNALSFDGVDDRVDCGNDPSLNITGNAVTLEAWIYPTAWKTNTFEANIVNSEGPNSGYMLRCGDNGKLDFNLGDGAGFHQIISPANTLTLNTWQHVAGTYDGDSLRMYVNGVEIMSLHGVFNIASTGNPMAVGDWTNGTGRNFPGKIDEVRVWNTAVSGANILAHMNTAYCGNETGLVAYYQFDQGIANGANPTETTLNDLTGYANNGTLTGFTLDGASSNWVVGVTDIGDCVPVACATPIGLAISNATANSFDISWIDNGSAGYEYEVRTEGAPGSGSTGLVNGGTAASGADPINIGGLSENTTYYVYVLSDCDGGLFSDWSSPAVLHLGYCVPEGTNELRFIDDFVTTGGGANIDNSGSGFSAGGYGDFSAMSASTYAGESIDFTATYEGGTFHTRIWVDWNNDFDFDDADELVFDGPNYLAEVTGSITVPAGTPEGSYRLRIRQGWTGTPTPCESNALGETEDYTFMVTAMPTCLHPVDIVTTAMTTSSVDFSWTASASDPADGYQWEVRSSGDPGSGAVGLAASGSTAAGVTNDGATGLTADTDYFIYVRSVCGSGDTSSWEGPTDIHTGYCVSTSTENTTYFSNFVTTGGGLNISNATGYAPNGYGDYTSQVVSQVAGLSVDFATTMTGGSAGTAIWVDWNNDLDFEDAGEQVFVTTLYGYDQTGTIIVPAGTPDGSYRMRILCDYFNSAPSSACGVIDNAGETEDYTFEVFTPEQCSGLPDPGATTGPAAVCADAPFTLAVENSSVEAGITYQWQISSDGVAWADAPGASTLATYTTSQTEETWYRLEVTCEFGDVATSTPLDVVMNPPMECYCASNFTNVTYEHITNVNFAGIDNTTEGIIGGPVDYTDQVAEVTQDDTHTLSVTILVDQFEYIYAFIDWNQNGVLNDAGEVYTVASNVEDVGPFTLDIATPGDALPGNTRMRVMLAYNNDLPDPCVSQTYGEAEDYTVHVTELVEVVDCEGVVNGPALPGTACYDTPNGWGGTWSDNCECDLNIGIADITAPNGFAVFPNPASTTLFITTPDKAPVHVKVYDMVGNLVMEQDMVHQLDIADLATGSYSLVATDSKGGHEAHARFMKQ
jgi:hypothetical protein